VSHLISNVGQWRLGLDEEAPKCVPQVVKPEAPKVCTLERRQEIVFDQVAHADRITAFAREDQILCDRRPSGRERFEQPLIPQFL
jgi:hypothetical protein